MPAQPPPPPPRQPNQTAAFLPCDWRRAEVQWLRQRPARKNFPPAESRLSACQLRHWIAEDCGCAHLALSLLNRRDSRQKSSKNKLYENLNHKPSMLKSVFVTGN